jgi:hypothetical protein
MRSIKLETDGEMVGRNILTAVRPLRIIAMVAMALTIPLWTEARWQPLAHAVFMPTLVAWGIAGAITTFGRRATSGRATAQEGA